MPAWVRRNWWLLAFGGVIVVLVAVTLVWSTRQPPVRRVLPPTRARVFSSTNVCLLTGAAGVTDPAAAPVWGGLQDASTVTRAQTSYLAAVGPQTPANVNPYLESLVTRRCAVIVAVGPAETAAVQALAPSLPQTRFVTVGAGTEKSNLSVVESGPALTVRSAVTELVESVTS